jgi:hypothetical protein
MKIEVGETNVSNWVLTFTKRSSTRKANAADDMKRDFSGWFL